MLYAYIGSDRDKARVALNAAVKKNGKGVSVIRVSDASPLGDVQGALSSGASLFGDKRAVVVDSLAGNAEMYDLLLEALPGMAGSSDSFFVLEGKPVAELKKALQKHAEKVETFDAPKSRGAFPFALPDALKKGDKKNAWVQLQREFIKGSAPEALHGILFWGAKQMLLKMPADARAKRLVAQLAELPHEARRQGEELEYALERFVLSIR